MEKNEELRQQSAYFKYIPSFSIVVFMASLMTAAIINTQAGMEQMADILAFFGFGYLLIGIAAQFIKMRK